MEYGKDNVCCENKDGEAREKKKDPEKKPGMLKKVISKIAVPLVAGIIAVGGAMALPSCGTEVKSVYPNCDCYEDDKSETTDDSKDETDVENDVDGDTELDMPADVPEEEMDAPDMEEDAEEDVPMDVEEEDTAADTGEDTGLDTSTDTEEEDTATDTLDVAEEDASLDTSMDTEEEDTATDTGEDTGLDTSTDTEEEDTAADTGEDTGLDTSTDTSDEDVVADAPGELDVDVAEGETCEAEDVPLSVAFLRPGEYVTDGNITILYGGLSIASEGIYEIYLCGVYETTLYIREGGSDSATLSEGTNVDIQANTARSHGSNLFYEIDAP
jgi:hypothetical protein